MARPNDMVIQELRTHEDIFSVAIKQIYRFNNFEVLIMCSQFLCWSSSLPLSLLNNYNPHCTLKYPTWFDGDVT